MSTVTEIKKAVRKLPTRKKMELVRWMQMQVDEGRNDGTVHYVAAEGPRTVDHREAARARRMTKHETAQASHFLSDFDKAVKTVATGVQPTGSIVATLAKMRR